MGEHRLKMSVRRPPRRSQRNYFGKIHGVLTVVRPVVQQLGVNTPDLQQIPLTNLLNPKGLGLKKENRESEFNEFETELSLILTANNTSYSSIPVARALIIFYSPNKSIKINSYPRPQKCSDY